jgi:hypothetical protein
MMRLRDSLAYRAEAVLWHPNLIRAVQSSARRRLRETRDDRTKQYLTLFQVGAEHFYAFDDLVFNALSLFDYVGNIVGFAYYGDRRRKAKWARIERFARDGDYERREHPHPRISPSNLGQCIREVHGTFVRALTDFRGALIHYEAMVGTGEFTELHGNDTAQQGPQYDVAFTVAKEFGRHFTIPGYEASRENAPLLEAASWLAQEAERTARIILVELEVDLKVEAGPQTSVEIIS